MTQDEGGRRQAKFDPWFTKLKTLYSLACCTGAATWAKEALQRIPVSLRHYFGATAWNMALWFLFIGQPPRCQCSAALLVHAKTSVPLAPRPSCFNSNPRDIMQGNLFCVARARAWTESVPTDSFPAWLSNRGATPFRIPFVLLLPRTIAAFNPDDHHDKNISMCRQFQFHTMPYHTIYNEEALQNSPCLFDICTRSITQYIHTLWFIT